MGHQTNDDITVVCFSPRCHTIEYYHAAAFIAKAASRDCFVSHVITISKQDDGPSILSRPQQRKVTIIYKQR